MIDMTIKVVDDQDRTVVTYSNRERAHQADLVGYACLSRVREQWTHLDNREQFGFYVWDDAGTLLSYA